MAKLIAEKIKMSLYNLIDAGQSGFLKGRCIGQNIITVFDIMHFAESKNIPAILVSVDFEKAFDKLDWSFINKCLENYYFPPFIDSGSKYFIPILLAVLQITGGTQTTSG